MGVNAMANEWQKSAPTESGFWLHRCEERDIEVNAVIISNSKKGFIVHCQYLDKPVLLSDFYNNFSQSEWRKTQ
jgi:hypothetical protein